MEEALLKKIDNAYRWQIIIKCKPEHLEEIKVDLKVLDERFANLKECKFNMDLDAVNIL